MNKTDILGKFSFYRNAPAALRSKIAATATVARLPAGAMFYRQGAACDQYALVGTGSIRVYRIGENGREITLYHVRDGETCLVNMLSVFLRQPAAANAQTETAVEAAIIPGVVAREWARSNDMFRNFVFETMGQRLLNVMTLVEEITFRKMDSRLASLLKERFAKLRVITATHEEIAVELGTAREVISRLLKDLERRGAIELSRGHILLRDEARLVALASAEKNRRSVTKSRKSARPKT